MIICSSGKCEIQHHNSNSTVLYGSFNGHSNDLQLIIKDEIMLSRFSPESSDLSPGHPGNESGPPTQGVATEPQHGPGQEVAPGDQVEEEDVHDDPTDKKDQHDGQPQRTTQSALDLLTQLRLPLK